jgi:serine/threonine-protein kinase GIN4
MSSYVTSMYSKALNSPGLSGEVSVLRDGQISHPATISGASAANIDLQNDLLDTGSPSKKKERSKSHGDLLQQRIRPTSLLETPAATEDDGKLLFVTGWLILRNISVAQAKRMSSSKLSDILPKHLFVSPRHRSVDATKGLETPANRSKSFDELSDSPQIVEPYPPRPTSSNAHVPDTPDRHHLEGVYDRFLMATSGVKRVGKGYQSTNTYTFQSSTVGPAAARTSHRPFYTGRRAMPPPVSSEDLLRKLTTSISVDEMGMMVERPVDAGDETPMTKDESNATVARVRRALKAIVPNNKTSRRLSRHAL